MNEKEEKTMEEGIRRDGEEGIRKKKRGKEGELKGGKGIRKKESQDKRKEAD